LEQLACENLLLKEEISKMRTALNRNSKLPVLTDLNTTTRTRAQTIYS
jgi:hypothetical protein